MFGIKISLSKALLLIVALIATQAFVLHLLGQPPICKCGFIKFWESAVLSSENSQHITDWYTFSHIIHGFLFYVGLYFAFPRMPVLWRLAIATGIEASWEIFENTPMVINAYREQALAQGYIGDSIINSVSDTLSMIIGFFASTRLPVWIIVSVAIFLEIFTAFMVRDNLTLNIIGFIHHFDFITAWQLGL